MKNYDATDSEAIKKLEEEKDFLKRQRKRDLFEILNLPSGAGERFFKNAFQDGKVLESTFTGNSQGMFLEGYRAMATNLLKEIGAIAPDKIADLLGFNNKKEQNNE